MLLSVGEESDVHSQEIGSFNSKICLLSDIWDVCYDQEPGKYCSSKSEQGVTKLSLNPLISSVQFIISYLKFYNLDNYLKDDNMKPIN